MKEFIRLIDKSIVKLHEERKAIDGKIETLLKMRAVLEPKPRKTPGPKKRKKPTKIDAKVKAKIKELHKSGHTYPEIQDLLQVSTSSIARVMQAS